MKKRLVNGIAVIGMIALASCTAGRKHSTLEGEDESFFDFENKTHQASYILGRDAGKTLRDMEGSIDIDLVVVALYDAYYDAPPQLSDSAVAAIATRLQQELHEKHRQKQKGVEETNLAAALSFLEKNKNNEGVTVTESGLQYIVIKEGAGPKPNANDKVSVLYTGSLVDGTIFDSSLDPDSPVTFPLGSVIRGWTEALQLMNVGSKYKFFIPPSLAYGSRGATGSPIGPNMALIFEVDLVGIEGKETAETTETAVEETEAAGE